MVIAWGALAVMVVIWVAGFATRRQGEWMPSRAALVSWYCGVLIALYFVALVAATAYRCLK